MCLTDVRLGDQGSIAKPVISLGTEIIFAYLQVYVEVDYVDSQEKGLQWGKDQDQVPQ